MTRTRKSKSAPVGVIGKVLRLLELLDRSPAGLPLKDLAAETGINKSTAHRFVTHLESEGYLFRDEDGMYMVGPKLVRLGSGTTFQATLCRLCHPTLKELLRSSGETVNLAVMDGLEVVYLDVLESLHTFRLVSQVGMKRPIYSTSLGKAMLGALNDEKRREEIYAAIHLEAATPHTATNLAKLKREVAQAQQRGYAIDDEEVVAGARCIGAAFFDRDGNVCGGISVSGPTSRITREKIPELAAAVQHAAHELSLRLGYRDDFIAGNRGPKAALALQRRQSPSPGMQGGDDHRSIPWALRS